MALEPDEDDVAWREYCRCAATLNRQYLLDAVLSVLDGDESLLWHWIDEACTMPHEPGRAQANRTELAGLGQAVLNVIAEAVDGAIAIKQMVGGSRDA